MRTPPRGRCLIRKSTHKPLRHLYPGRGGPGSLAKTGNKVKNIFNLIQEKKPTQNVENVFVHSFQRRVHLSLLCRSRASALTFPDVSEGSCEAFVWRCPHEFFADKNSAMNETQIYVWMALNMETCVNTSKVSLAGPPFTEVNGWCKTRFEKNQLRCVRKLQATGSTQYKIDLR
jgi:hypothetical protein